MFVVFRNYLEKWLKWKIGIDMNVFDVVCGFDCL